MKLPLKIRAALPKRTWSDYILTKLLDERIIKSRAPCLIGGGQILEGILEVFYNVNFPNHTLSFGPYLRDNGRTLKFDGEYVQYIEEGTGDSFRLDINGSKSKYSISLAHLVPVKDVSDEEGNLIIHEITAEDIARDKRDSAILKALGSGSRVNTAQWANQFLDILIRDHRANAKNR